MAEPRSRGLPLSVGARRRVVAGDDAGRPAISGRALVELDHRSARADPRSRGLPLPTPKPDSQARGPFRGPTRDHADWHRNAFMEVVGRGCVGPTRDHTGCRCQAVARRQADESWQTRDHADRRCQARRPPRSRAWRDDPRSRGLPLSGLLIHMRTVDGLTRADLRSRRLPFVRLNPCTSIPPRRRMGRPAITRTSVVSRPGGRRRRRRASRADPRSRGRSCRGSAAPSGLSRADLRSRGQEFDLPLADQRSRWAAVASSP